MSKYIIETNHLTKQYGNQVSVSQLNIHVKKGVFMDSSDVTEQEKQPR